jgi:sterol desaturase/sphingolipid hydroxylase (fatty acid hydroxylase superfamily)
MSKIASHFLDGWRGFVQQIYHPAWGNFFYLLVFISLAVLLLEILFPWRKNQRIFRKDFFLDVFYMFFNMFFFPLLGFATASMALAYFAQVTGIVPVVSGVIPLAGLSLWLQLLILFVLRDLLQWSIHVALHRYKPLWKIHEVHHSARLMSFPVHLRYHWGENIIYRIPEFLLMTMLSVTIRDFFIVYVISLAIGHLNHANLKLPWGPLKYVFNTSELHMWHHAVKFPARYGINYGISLSLWDWIFHTAYNPAEAPAEIGLSDEPDFPRGLVGQLVWPFVKYSNHRQKDNA